MLHELIFMKTKQQNLQIFKNNKFIFKWRQEKMIFCALFTHNWEYNLEILERPENHENCKNTWNFLAISFTWFKINLHFELSLYSLNHNICTGHKFFSKSTHTLKCYVCVCSEYMCPQKWKTARFTYVKLSQHRCVHEILKM